METHVLHATTPEGRTIEIGRLGSLEAAARLRARLESELGDEYASFEISETAPEPWPPVMAARFPRIHAALLRRAG